MHPQKKPSIAIQSEITLTQEQYVDAIMQYLRNNNINVENIEQVLVNQSQLGEPQGVRLKVTLGGVISTGPVYRGNDVGVK
jgi:hypothetical protein